MKGRVALFIHHPKCSIQCGNGIIQALGPDYEFKIFTRHQVEEEFFDNVDMVAVPGGIGDADSFDYLMRENLPRLRRFMAEGGRYLGICMGAYWAAHHYMNILDGVDAVQYIKRPGTDIRRSYGTTAPVMWNGEPERMYFYDGCAFVGDRAKFTTVASYANGDPAAIIQNRIGLIGPHPESNQYWYDRKFLEPHWHQGRHHVLLKQFVDRLMDQ
jgi:glutamine amidotransferase-like uncharacterized protein